MTKQDHNVVSLPATSGLSVAFSVSQQLSQAWLSLLQVQGLGQHCRYCCCSGTPYTVYHPKLLLEKRAIQRRIYFLSGCSMHCQNLGRLALLNVNYIAYAMETVKSPCDQLETLFCHMCIDQSRQKLCKDHLRLPYGLALVTVMEERCSL